VNTQSGTSCITLACPAVSPGSARLRNLPPTLLRMTMGDVEAVRPYATHGQKRFAMAGIATNVWPLGPQEWTSG
jgi:hypothetical protein